MSRMPSRSASAIVRSAALRVSAGLRASTWLAWRAAAAADFKCSFSFIAPLCLTAADPARAGCTDASLQRRVLRLSVDVNQCTLPAKGLAARGLAVEEIMSITSRLLWLAVTLLGTVSLGIVALTRGEAVNAAWLVTAAVCIYFIAYRFYGLFIARTVFRIDRNRPTPAYRHNDGLDYVPTNKYVLFGHHFAAIAGAGSPFCPRLGGPRGLPAAALRVLGAAVLAGAGR